MNVSQHKIKEDKVMKKLMAVLAAGVVASSAFAGKTYYVDAENGDNGWDGSCAVHVDGTDQGPRQSLASVMALTVSGDVVYALPGVYSTDTMTAIEKNSGNVDVSVRSRVVVKAGVQLISTEGAEKTVIVGEADPDAPLWNGCGENSVRCVCMQNTWMGATSRIVGFTLTGGHAYYKSDTDYTYGGGIRGVGGSSDYLNLSSIENCVISNNVAYHSAGGYSGAYIGCCIADNQAYYRGGVNGGKALFLFDCFVGRNSATKENYQAGQPRYSYNTTFIGDVIFSWANSELWNCVLDGYVANYAGSAANKGYHNCVILFRNDNKQQLQYGDADCQLLTADEMNIDALGRPLPGSPLIDAGSNTYHLVNNMKYPTKDVTAGNYWTDALLRFDALGIPRILNGSIDIGGHEYDWRKGFSAALDALGDVTVTNVSSDVTLKDAKTVLLTANTMLALTWKPHMGDSANYKFHACVTGTGVLTIAKNGTAWQTLTAADGDVWLSVAQEGVLGLDFAYAAGEDDEGGAELHDFSNVSYALVEASDGGLVLNGATVGVNYVQMGGTLSFTVKRTFDRADCICTGVTSNGVFYAFDDYPDGLAFTVSDAQRNNIVLLAVYDRSAVTAWYVDAVNGDDDSNYGYHPKNPLKTLEAVMAKATKSGDVVYAFPGVYSNGTMRASASGGLCRVVVPAYVTLVSTEGPEKTFIVGEADPEEPLYDGCGPNSVRGAYVNNYARLSGFTITGGHAQYKSDSDYERGGGVLAQGCNLTPAKIGVIDNCIISNNVAYSGGGCGFGGYVGCRIVDNRAPEKNYSAIVSTREAFLFDCYVKSAGWAADFSYAYNTTFDCTIHGKWGSNMCKNCVILGGILNYMGLADAPGCSNCVLVSSCKSAQEPYSDSATRFMTREEMMVDADGRPLKGSPLIGMAVADYHDTAPFPSALGGVSSIDALGLPRVSNATMDIGGYEYDWRPDYAADLGRYTTVPEATPGVVEASGKVRLTDGEEILIGVHEKAGGPFRISFTIEGAGTLSVRRGETLVATLTAADSPWPFTLSSDRDALSFTFEGEGAAELSHVGSGRGLAIILR